MIEHTYDFFVIDLEATHDQVHGLLLLSILLVVGDIARVVLIGGALEIESAIIVVDNLQHGHVLWRPLSCVELLLEARLAIVGREH